MATKNTASRKGKHLPSVRFTFVNLKTKQFAIVNNDIGHRKVTTVVGKVGTAGTMKARYFEDRDSLRDFVDARIENLEASGFVAVNMA